jgi:hypothetical protein
MLRHMVIRFIVPVLKLAIITRTTSSPIKVFTRHMGTQKKEIENQTQDFKRLPSRINA